jgi:hypothetical protein
MRTQLLAPALLVLAALPVQAQQRPLTLEAIYDPAVSRDFSGTAEVPRQWLDDDTYLLVAREGRAFVWYRVEAATGARAPLFDQTAMEDALVSIGVSRGEAKGDAVKLDQVVPLVRRALAVLSERDVTPQLGLLKSTLLQLDSTFSEKSYGAGSFREFAQKLERAGVLTVSQGKGGWMVGPVVGGAVAGDAAGPATTDDPGEAATPPESRAREPRGQDGRGPRPPMPETIGNAADGVRELAVILAGAEVRRWPLYLRNLKQIIKQVRPTFDERAYGFANLTDLARAAHREGVLRIERDRQGNIRMFQGTASLSGVPTAAAGDADEVGASEGVGADAAEAGVDDSGVVEDVGNTVSDRDDDQGADVAGDERDERAAKAPAKAPARGRAARGKAAHDDQDSEHEAGDVNGNVASPRKGAASRASKSRRPATARKATATPRRPRAKKKS